MEWVMGMNESAKTKGKCHHGKRISPKMSKDRGIWHSVRERMIKHNRKDHMMKRAWYLLDKYPETGKDRSNSDWRALLIIIWRGDGGIWHNDDMTNLVTMELVLLWYKTRHHVSLVIQSLFLTTTQQLPNKPSTSLSNMPMTNSRTFQSVSGLNTITRFPPKRSGGDYPSGQQVVIANLVSFWLKTDLFRPRFMTWSLLTSLWPRSSRLLEWTTTSGFKPFSTTKSWRGSRGKNRLTLIRGSFGGSLGWG